MTVNMNIFKTQEMFLHGDLSVVVSHGRFDLLLQNERSKRVYLTI